MSRLSTNKFSMDLNEFILIFQTNHHKHHFSYEIYDIARVEKWTRRYL